MAIFHVKETKKLKPFQLRKALRQVPNVAVFSNEFDHCSIHCQPNALPAINKVCRRFGAELSPGYAPDVADRLRNTNDGEKVVEQATLNAIAVAREWAI